MVTRKPGKIFAGIGGWNLPHGAAPSTRGPHTDARTARRSRQITSIETNRRSRFGEARDVPEVGTTNARRIRVQCQGPEVRHTTRTSRRARVEHRALPRQRRSATRRQAGPINWQLAPTKHFDAEEIAELLALLPRKIEGRTLRHVLEVRHASFDCEGVRRAGGAPIRSAVVEAAIRPTRESRRTPHPSAIYADGQRRPSPKGYAPTALGALAGTGADLGTRRRRAPVIRSAAQSNAILRWCLRCSRL